MGEKPFPNIILKVSSSGTNLGGERSMLPRDVSSAGEKQRAAEKHRGVREMLCRPRRVTWSKSQMMFFRFPKARVEGKTKPHFPHGSPNIAG